MKRPNIHKYPWEAQEYIQHLERKLESMVSSSNVIQCQHPFEKLTFLVNEEVECECGKRLYIGGV